MMIVAEKQRHIHSELLPNLSSFINHSAFRGENQQRATNRRRVPCRLGASSASNLQSISTRVEFLIMGRFHIFNYGPISDAPLTRLSPILRSALLSRWQQKRT